MMIEKLGLRSEDNSSGWDTLDNTPSFEDHIANLDDFDEENPFSNFNFNMESKNTINIDALSQPMKDFFERQGYDLYDLPSGLGRPLLNAEDLGDMYRKMNRSEAKHDNIFVGDIIGSQGIKEHNTTLASFMSYLYKNYDDSSSYNGRAVSHLGDNYKRVARDILENITPGDYVSDGKSYFLCGDGNHRIFYLATALELELAECGNDETQKSEVISKYKIPAMVHPTDSVKDLGAILEKKTKASSFEIESGWDFL